MKKNVDVKNPMYKPNRRSKNWKKHSELQERAKEMIRMWVKEMKKIESRIEKLGDIKNSMQRSITHLIECPGDILRRMEEHQYLKK